MKKKLISSDNDNCIEEININNNNNNTIQPNVIIKSDNSPHIPQRSKFKGELTVYERKFSDKQLEFINLVNDKNNKLILADGPAGCAKTFTSVYCALRMINEKKVSDLVYVRSVVESADSKIGFLPGFLNEKLEIYLEPLYDKLNELLPKNQIDILKKDNRISAIPVNFLRGLNWNAKVVILDEAQNCSTKELITFITRIGEYSKVILIGDSFQNDINGRSGFIKMINMFDDDESKQNGIQVVRFTDDDIVRSKLVKFIVKKLNTFS